MTNNNLTITVIVGLGSGVLGALVTAIIGAVVTTRNLIKTLAHQQEQERLKDARVLRDKQAERLRGAYIALVEAAFAMNTVVAEMQVRYEGEDEDQREARIYGRWQEHIDSLNRALVQLEVEPEAQQILPIIRRVSRAFEEYRLNRTMNREEPGAIPWREVRAKRGAMEAAIDELLAAVRNQLATLDQPLPVPITDAQPTIERRGIGALWHGVRRWRRKPGAA